MPQGAQASPKPAAPFDQSSQSNGDANIAAGRSATKSRIPTRWLKLSIFNRFNKDPDPGLTPEPDPDWVQWEQAAIRCGDSREAMFREQDFWCLTAEGSKQYYVSVLEEDQVWSYASDNARWARAKSTMRMLLADLKDWDVEYRDTQLRMVARKPRDTGSPTVTLIPCVLLSCDRKSLRRVKNGIARLSWSRPDVQDYTLILVSGLEGGTKVVAPMQIRDLDMGEPIRISGFEDDLHIHIEGFTRLARLVATPLSLTPSPAESHGLFCVASVTNFEKRLLSQWISRIGGLLYVEDSEEERILALTAGHGMLKHFVQLRKPSEEVSSRTTLRHKHTTNFPRDPNRLGYTDIKRMHWVKDGVFPSQISFLTTLEPPQEEENSRDARKYLPYSLGWTERAHDFGLLELPPSLLAAFGVPLVGNKHLNKLWSSAGFTVEMDSLRLNKDEFGLNPRRIQEVGILLRPGQTVSARLIPGDHQLVISEMVFDVQRLMLSRPLGELISLCPYLLRASFASY